MADEKMEKALSVYGTLCASLDELNIEYRKTEEKLRINCTIRGEDIPMDIVGFVDAERQCVTLFSHMPFIIPEDKRLDVAIATSITNYYISEGCFDFDVSKGHIFFRLTNSYAGTDAGNELFRYMLYKSCSIIDDYNDKFLMLAKGAVSIEDYIAQLTHGF